MTDADVLITNNAVLRSNILLYGNNNEWMPNYSDLNAIKFFIGSIMARLSRLSYYTQLHTRKIAFNLM